MVVSVRVSMVVEMFRRHCPPVRPRLQRAKTPSEGGGNRPRHAPQAGDSPGARTRFFIFYYFLYCCIVCFFSFIVAPPCVFFRHNSMMPELLEDTLKVRVGGLYGSLKLACTW